MAQRSNLQSPVLQDELDAFMDVAVNSRFDTPYLPIAQNDAAQKNYFCSAMVPNVLVARNNKKNKHPISSPAERHVRIAYIERLVVEGRIDPTLLTLPIINTPECQAYEKADHGD